MLELTLESLVRAALIEDVGPNDATTAATVPEASRCRARLIAKESGVLSGMAPFRMAFGLLDANIEDWHARSDGIDFGPGDILAEFTGHTRAVLSAERTALNFVQRLCGVATLTARYVEALKGLETRVCDTRKTTPLLRALEKEAVRHGGGVNHRAALFDGVLIKENHITAAGGIGPAVSEARRLAHHLLRIEVEVQDLESLEAALAANADVILLDNMDLDTMRAAVERARPHGVLLEASGNVTLERVRAIAETGVHLISAGALTHSAPAIDLTLLVENV